QVTLWDVRTQRVLLRTQLGIPKFSPDDQELLSLTATPKGMAIEFLKLEISSPRQCLIAKDNAGGTGYARGAFEPRSGLLFMSNPLNTGAVSRFYEPWSGRELACEALNDVYPTALDAGGRFVLGSTKQGLFRWPLQVRPGQIEIGKPVHVCSNNATDAIQLTTDGAIA